MFPIQLSEAEARQILEAMDCARDAIQPITTAQVKLYNLNPRTDELLDAAAKILMDKAKE